MLTSLCTFLLGRLHPFTLQSLLPICHVPTHLFAACLLSDLSRQGGLSPSIRPMSSSGRPLTGFARPGTGSARPGTTSSNKPGTALSAALKGARPGTSSTRPLTTSGRWDLDQDVLVLRTSYSVSANMWSTVACQKEYTGLTVTPAAEILRATAWQR